MATGAAIGRHRAAGKLLPYAPRLVSEWLDTEPGTRVRTLEGTIVFADISGFTSLAERLARQGRVGAELLTEELDATFTSLLAVAYGAGGGLLKFGGDALLLWFDGPWHGARAAASAVGMRRVLREIQKGSGGRRAARLRMSVGIHSGTFAFFLLGESHREVVVAGPAASRVVLMESTATAGEIVISQDTADALPRRCWGAERSAGRLLRTAPALPDASFEPGRPAPLADISVAIPVAIRDHLLAGGTGAEHRQVTVAFVLVGGVDDAVTTAGPASVARDLDDLVSDVQRAAAVDGVSFLGTDIAADGAKVILVAGVPTSSEDHEERMLLTLRTIIEKQRPLPVRVGVHRGAVFAGDVGPPYRRTYTVMGDTVNLAARLMAAARPGQILATPSVLSRSKACFRTTALTPFTVKGKSQPVQSHIVGPLLAERRSDRTGRDVALVGRATELGVLLRAAQATRHGQGAVVHVTGEPGSGKTRLIEELLASAGDMVVVPVRGDVYGRSTPYRVAARLLLSAVGGEGDGPAAALARIAGRVAIDRPDLTPWLPLLSDVLGTDVLDTPESGALEPQFRRSRVAGLVSSVMRMVLRSPTVVVVDDGHAIDEASSDVLETLCADVEGRPWLVIVARRAVTGGFVPRGERVHTIELGALDRDQTVTLAEEATRDNPLPGHVLTAVVERSAGNPLFLLKLVAEGARLGTDALPESLEDVVTARLDRLGPEERTLLRHASVVGATFTADALGAVTGGTIPGDDPVWDGLEEFVERSDGGFRFRQTLVRDAAYEGLPFRIRRDLHARLAQWLLATAADPLEVTDLLALHFTHAGRHADAWEFGRLAGDRGAQRYANAEAKRFYRWALDAARRLPDASAAGVAAVQEFLGEVTERLGEFEAARVAYRAARRALVGDPVARGRLFLKEAWIPHRLGRSTEALRLIGRGLGALKLAGPEGAAQRARLSASYAAILRDVGRIGACATWARRAIGQAEEAGDREALAHGCSILSWALATAGDREYRAYARRALGVYEDLGDLGGQAHVLTYLGAFAYFEGRWEDAVAFYERGKEARERTGDAVSAAYGTINIAEILSDQGHLDRAEQLLRSAMRVWQAAGYRAGVAWVQQQLARVAARSGRPEEALEIYERSLTEFLEIGDRASITEVDTKVAEALLLKGDVQACLFRVRKTKDAAIREAGGVHLPMLRRIEGMALFADGYVDGARAALEDSLRLARDRDAPYEVAQSLSALANVLRAAGQDASDLADEAARIYERLGVVARFVPTGVRRGSRRGRYFPPTNGSAGPS